MSRYMRIDVSALNEAIAHSGYQVTVEEVKEAARRLLGLRGEYYGPLVIKDAPLNRPVVPYDLIPVGMMTGTTGWDESGKRHKWLLSVGQTPGSSIYGGLEPTWARLYAKLVEEV